MSKVDENASLVQKKTANKQEDYYNITIRQQA